MDLPWKFPSLPPIYPSTIFDSILSETKIIIINSKFTKSFHHEVLPYSKRSIGMRTCAQQNPSVSLCNPGNVSLPTSVNGDNGNLVCNQDNIGTADPNLETVGSVTQQQQSTVSDTNLVSLKDINPKSSTYKPPTADNKKGIYKVSTVIRIC